MLLEIPQEVILNVASYLLINDKITLMTTCSTLYTLILNRILFEELSFYGPQEETEYIISKFSGNCSRKLNGNQVKVLKIKFDHLPDQVFSQLPILFPNVTRIVDYSDYFPDDEEGDIAKIRNQDVMNEFLKWKDTIEHSGTFEDRSMIVRLLEKNVFSRLTSLDITLGYHEYNGRYKTDLHIVNCVGNAPSLLKLKLYGCKIDLDLLEAIHMRSPQLVSLKLEGFLTTDRQQRQLPTNIVPTNRLTFLSFGWDLIISDRNCLLLDYVIQKYPCLKHLVFFPTFSNYMVSYALHKFHGDEFEESGLDELSTLDRHADFEYTCDVYRNEGSRILLSRLPDTLETLELDASLFGNIIKSLQHTKINPRSLLFSKRFVESPVFEKPHELDYLKSINNLKMMKATLNPAIQTYDDGFLSYSLCKLTISIIVIDRQNSDRYHNNNSKTKDKDKGKNSDNNTFNIGWLLSLFPVLEELEIESSNVLLLGGGGGDGDDKAIGDKHTVYPNLRKLLVKECIVHRDLLGYVTTATPNIIELGWSILDGSYQNLLIGPKNQRSQKGKRAGGERRHVKKSNSNTERYTSPKSYCIDVTRLLNLEKLNLQINRGQDEADREYDIYGEIKIKDQIKKIVFSENFKPGLEITSELPKDIEKMTKFTLLCNHVRRMKINYNIEIEIEIEEEKKENIKLTIS